MRFLGNTLRSSFTFPFGKGKEDLRNAGCDTALSWPFAALYRSHKAVLRNSPCPETVCAPCPWIAVTLCDTRRVGHTMVVIRGYISIQIVRIAGKIQEPVTRIFCAHDTQITADDVTQTYLMMMLRKFYSAI